MKEIETQLAKKKNSNYLDRPYLIFMIQYPRKLGGYYGL